MNRYVNKVGYVASERYWREWAINLYSEGADIVPTPSDWWARVVRVLGLVLVEEGVEDDN